MPQSCPDPVETGEKQNSFLYTLASVRGFVILTENGPICLSESLPPETITLMATSLIYRFGKGDTNIQIVAETKISLVYGEE